MTAEGWREQAACLGRRDMFPEAEATQQVIARAVCGACPVEYVCRHELMHERYGVIGGMTEDQRERERKRRQRQLWPSERRPSHERQGRAS